MRKRLIEGNHLNIHYFECVGTGAEFVDCNCRDFAVELRRTLQHLQASPSISSSSGSLSSAPSTPVTVSDTASEMSRSSSLYNSSPSQYSPTPAYASSNYSYGSSHSQASTTSYSTATYPQYPYALGHNGTPINTANGVVATQSTGIHIKGLSFSTSQRSLDKFLVEMKCQPISCAIKYNRENESKGSAT